MRILWISMNPGLYGVHGGNDSYNGGGWISSLQRLIEGCADWELGIAFLSPQALPSLKVGRTSYFPILEKQSRWSKLFYYYHSYKNYDINKYTTVLDSIVKDFKPDLIHLFGVENHLAGIVHCQNAPIVAHIQGILGPCSAAYWPSGINHTNFLWPPSIREWVLQNGIIHMRNYTKVRAKQEQSIFERIPYFMGRTEWDKSITSLMAPKSKYFHVDEMLRPTFYENAGKWKCHNGKLKLISVISENPYKGLDLILKTAHILHSKVDFEWEVVGLQASSKMVKAIEKTLDIESKNVGVIYAGIFSEKMLCQAALAADIYIHPSYIDNSPNSLCEAQLLGMPCISTNVGGISTLIQHLGTGILVPANAPFDLALQILNLHANSTLAEKLGKSATEVAQRRHHPNSILSQLTTTYNRILLDSKEK